MQIDDILEGSNNNTIREWLSWMTEGGTNRMNTFNHMFKVSQELNTVPISS